MDVMAAHLTAPAPSLHGLASEMPADLVAIVARCLSKEPEDRPASASDLEHALAACSSVSAWDAAAAAAWWHADSDSREEKMQPSGVHTATVSRAEQDATATAPPIDELGAVSDDTN